MLVFGIASGVSAQKVITDHSSASGYPVIDVSELAPLGCVLMSTEASQRRSDINAQEVSNSDFVTPRGEDYSGMNGRWNKQISLQFQVMRADHSIGTDWAKAFVLCRTYDGEGGAAGQWRLPTQREFMMIWVLHPQLRNKGNITAFDTRNYWCCTEHAANSAWLVYFGNGTTLSTSKTGSFNVRCVRDL